MERRDTAPAGHRTRESRQAVPQQTARGAGAQMVRGGRESPAAFDAWGLTRQMGSATPSKGSTWGETCVSMRGKRGKGGKAAIPLMLISAP